MYESLHSTIVILGLNRHCHHLVYRYQGERQGTPWTGRQSITGPHRDKRDTQPCILTLRVNLKTLINLTCMFLDVWEHTHKWGEHANSTQKGPNRIRTRNLLAVRRRAAPHNNMDQVNFKGNSRLRLWNMWTKLTFRIEDVLFVDSGSSRWSVGKNKFC